MNTSQLARSAYGSDRRATRPIVSQEYDAIARVTADLKKAEPGISRANAVHQNRELWTLFAIDVANDANALPDATRASILSLAAFTHAQSSKVLSDTGSMDILIEINTAVMRGLRQQGARG